MKHYIRWMISVFLYHSGALSVLRWWKSWRADGKRVIVLRYHRVNRGALADPFHLSVSPDVFKKQMEYVKKNYEVISCAQIENNKNAALAVTFDDGYLDNYTEAFPVLKSLKMPATVFVSAGLIGKEDVFWWDDLERLVNQSNKPNVELSWKEPDGLSKQEIFDLSSSAAKVATLEKLEAVCNRVPDAEQKRILSFLASEVNGKHVDSHLHGNDKGSRVTLSWEEAKDLSNSGVAIGSHGVNHVLLTKVSREKALEEIVESKRIINEKLDGTVKHFAFPGGQIEGWMLEAVKNAGYETAFSTQPGENFGNFDRFRIRRRAVHESISINPLGKYSEAMFACAVEGVFEIGLATADSRFENDGRIKILYVIDKLTRAGSQRHLLQLVRSLNRQEFDLKIVALECGGPLEDELKRLDIPYRIIGISNWNGWGGVKGFSRLFREIQEFKPDIVHSYLLTANFFSPLAARILKVPAVIASRRDLGDWMSARQITMCKISNRFVDLVLANSNAVRDEAVKREALDPRLMKIVYNGININEFTPSESKEGLRKRFGLPEHSIIIGTLGNIRLEKDPLTLLRAFELIQRSHKDVFLAHGGRVKDERLKAEIDAWVSKHGLEKNIRFMGAVERAQDFLGAIDIFVFPSKTEGLSNAILEAMSASLPVVATRVGGNAEQVLDGVTGFLFPVGDYDTCAAAVEKLIASADRRKELGAQGREHVRELFNEKRMAENMTGIYKQVLASKKAQK